MLSFISAGDSPEKVRRGAGAAVFAVGNVLGSPLKAEVAGIPPKKRWPPVAAADDGAAESPAEKLASPVADVLPSPPKPPPTTAATRGVLEKSPPPRPPPVAVGSPSPAKKPPAAVAVTPSPPKQRPAPAESVATSAKLSSKSPTEKKKGQRRTTKTKSPAAVEAASAQLWRHGRSRAARAAEQRTPRRASAAVAQEHASVAKGAAERAFLSSQQTTALDPPVAPVGDGALHVSARVEAMMRRVQRAWEDAEDRALRHHAELVLAQVAQRTLLGEMEHAEIDEEMNNKDRALLTRQRDDARGAAQRAEAAAEKAAALRARGDREHKSDKLKLAMADAERQALAAEVAALEREAADEAEATQAVLGKLQLAGHKRHESTKKQLALWDERLRQFLDAGHAARLELVLVSGNQHVFQEMHALLEDQRNTANHEAEALRGWELRHAWEQKKLHEDKVRELASQLEVAKRSQAEQLEAATSAVRAELDEKLGASRMESRVLERQLVDLRATITLQQKAMRQQSVEHRQALAYAAAELEEESAALREGMAKVVQVETAAVVALQKHEALREKTAARTLLKFYRGTLVKCFRAWAGHAAGSAARAGGATSAVGLAGAKAKRQLAALAAMGSGGGGSGGYSVGGYMEATVHSLEAEWSAHEEAMKRTIEGLRTELAAKKAEAEGARQENIKIRAALTEQAQAMAQEAADAATKAQEGNAAAERARREAEEARDALERGGVGGSGGAEAARLRAEALEREEKRRALEAALVAERQNRAEGLAAWRSELQQGEVKRLGLIEKARAADARVEALEAQVAELRAAAAASEERHAAAIAAACAELETERAARRAEGAANARWVSELHTQLKLAQQQQLGQRALELVDEVDRLRAALAEARGEGAAPPPLFAPPAAADPVPAPPPATEMEVVATEVVALEATAVPAVPAAVAVSSPSPAVEAAMALSVMEMAAAVAPSGDADPEAAADPAPAPGSGEGPLGEVPPTRRRRKKSHSPA